MHRPSLRAVSLDVQAIPARAFRDLADTDWIDLDVAQEVPMVVTLPAGTNLADLYAWCVRDGWDTESRFMRELRRSVLSARWGR